MATTPEKSHEVSNAQLALLNPEHSIQVRGARVHNLKDVDVDLRVIHLLFLPVYRARVNHRSPLEHYLPNRSIVILIRYRLMHAD